MDEQKDSCASAVQCREDSDSLGAKEEIRKCSGAGEESTAVLHLDDVQKSYRKGRESVQVLQDFTLKIYAGQCVALVGPSGSGKSTVLQIAGLLEPPTRGRVLIQGEATQTLSDRDRSRLRCKDIGFVFQAHRLMPDLSAVENVLLPQRIAGFEWSDALARAKDLLRMVGLEHRLHHRPVELSGGEQQRVAIARAFSNVPQLLLADEPTGNLDFETAKKIFSLLLESVRKTGLTALIATHDPNLAGLMDRQVSLCDGKLREM